MDVDENLLNEFGKCRNDFGKHHNESSRMLGGEIDSHRNTDQCPERQDDWVTVFYNER